MFSFFEFGLLFLVGPFLFLFCFYLCEMNHQMNIFTVIKKKKLLNQVRFCEKETPHMKYTKLYLLSINFVVSKIFQ